MTITILLYGAWAAMLFGGFIWGKPDADQYRRMPLWTRLGSTAALVILVWVLFARSGSGFILFFGVGISLGLIGDCFMADLFGWPRPAEIAGMLAFGAGHIAYIAPLLIIIPYVYVSQSAWLVVATWITWLIIAVIGWWFAVWRPAEGGARSFLHGAALPYGLLLASTVGVANGLAWAEPVFWPLTIGATLFLISDLLITVELFNGKRFKYMGDLIWLTYGPAQALIVSVSLLDT